MNIKAWCRARWLTVEPRRLSSVVAVVLVGVLGVALTGMASGATFWPGSSPGAAPVPTKPSGTPLAQGVYSPPVPGIRGSGSGSAIPGSYMVVLKDTTSLRAEGIAAGARALAVKYHGTLGHVYQYSLLGFSVDTTEAEAQRMAQDPSVSYVEQNQVMHSTDTQENPPSWGLDRVDQTTLPLDTTYTYDLPDPAGSAVTAYVVDSGIRFTLPDFGGRASWGWDFIGNTGIADDCDGHGTHVAGILGGATYGVAKNVKLVGVRVFDCTGTATPTSVQDGIEWVTAHAVKPAVVNVSIGRTCTDSAGIVVPCPAGTGSTIIDAITKSIGTGLSYVIAAGNDNINACGNPFARVPGSIVVGSTDMTDAKRATSNWGSCVDMWAPGGAITSDYVPKTVDSHGCVNVTTCQLSGTSMAAPHVAGAIARLLARPGWSDATPTKVKTEVLANMVSSGVITGLDAGSPNKLLYLQPPPVGGGSSIAVARNVGDGGLYLFGITPAGALQVRSQTSGWGLLAQSGDPGWYSVAAQTDGDSRIEMLGLQRKPQSIWLKRQASSGVSGNTWVAPHQVNGLLNSVAIAVNSAGRVEVFGTNSQGQGWHSSQQVGAGVATLKPWEPFDLPGALVRSVSADLNVDGLVEVFALTSTGQIWHRWETAKNSGTYTPWVRMDFTSGSLSSVAVTRNKDGLLQLFGVTTTGQTFFRDAVLGTNSWLSWTALPTAAQVGTPHSLAAETNTDGRVELFTVNVTGQVWHTSQTTAGSDTYSDWTQIASDPLRP